MQARGPNEAHRTRVQKSQAGQHQKHRNHYGGNGLKPSMPEWMLGIRGTAGQLESHNYCHRRQHVRQRVEGVRHHCQTPNGKPEEQLHTEQNDVEHDAQPSLEVCCKSPIVVVVDLLHVLPLQQFPQRPISYPGHNPDQRHSLPTKKPVRTSQPRCPTGEVDLLPLLGGPACHHPQRRPDHLVAIL